MVGFRHAEAGLREPPRGVRMVLFVRDGGPPPRGGQLPCGLRGLPHIARMGKILLKRIDLVIEAKGGRIPK